jgi:hypothetical protein
MPDESSVAVVDGAASESADAPAAVEKFESPPVAPVGERRESADPRARLHELALELVRTQNRRLLIEYLRLRRAGR